MEMSYNQIRRASSCRHCLTDIYRYISSLPSRRIAACLLRTWLGKLTFLSLDLELELRPIALHPLSGNLF